MPETIWYRGYWTEPHYSPEDGLFYGKIENVRDLVNYECETFDGIAGAFREAVDDYLAFCADMGVEDEKRPGKKPPAGRLLIEVIKNA